MDKAFLCPTTTQEEKEIIISNRFKNEDGASAAFKVRSMTQEEVDVLIKQAIRHTKNGDVFDGQDFNRRLIVAATVMPDFRAKELCDAYGVLDPLMVPGKMLLAGEFNKLLGAILDLSGME